MSDKRILPLSDLAERHSGLTESIAGAYVEAARVCLDRHHEPPAEFEIDEQGDKAAAFASWMPTDDRTRRAWANEIDTTESGAYACALAAVELTNGLVAVHRAETRTGADYYVAPAGTTLGDLEDCIRLEVSGVDHGPNSAVASRLAAKLEQTAAGKSNLPAMAGVVGFKALVIMIAPLVE